VNNLRKIQFEIHFDALAFKLGTIDLYINCNLTSIFPENIVVQNFHKVVTIIGNNFINSASLSCVYQYIPTEDKLIMKAVYLNSTSINCFFPTIEDISHNSRIYVSLNGGDVLSSNYLSVNLMLSPRVTYIKTPWQAIGFA
jgi:hypothetical protein